MTDQLGCLLIGTAQRVLLNFVAGFVARRLPNDASMARCSILLLQRTMSDPM
jgi:hypothetical protein